MIDRSVGEHTFMQEQSGSTRWSSQGRCAPQKVVAPELGYAHARRGGVDLAKETVLEIAGHARSQVLDPDDQIQPDGLTDRGGRDDTVPRPLQLDLVASRDGSAHVLKAR